MRQNTVGLVAGLLLWPVAVVVVCRPVGFSIFGYVTCHLLGLYQTGYARYCEPSQRIHRHLHSATLRGSTTFLLDEPVGVYDN